MKGTNNWLVANPPVKYAIVPFWQLRNLSNNEQIRDTLPFVLYILGTPPASTDLRDTPPPPPQPRCPGFENLGSGNPSRQSKSA